MNIQRLAVAALSIGLLLQTSPLIVPLHAQGQPRTASEQQMMERCKQAMAEHQQMMSRMKTADAELDKLVSRMNAAIGNEKVDATAAVVTEIVKQRQTMHTQMMQMHEHMMAHMSEHMQMADMQAMQRSMQACPMMKGMMTPKQNR